MKEKPYFVYPMLEALKDCTDPDRRMELKERIAVNVGDTEVLEALIGEGEDFRNFYPDKVRRHASTEDTINSFLEKFGSGDDQGEELPQLSPEAPTDYFASLVEREQMEPAQNAGLTYGLAKIMIKNGNYQKALEIIHEIYLNNPEKSVYFADQIRFIRKLMYIEECKKRKNNK